MGTADFGPGAGTASLTRAGGSDSFVSKLARTGYLVETTEESETSKEHHKQASSIMSIIPPVMSKRRVAILVMTLLAITVSSVHPFSPTQARATGPTLRGVFFNPDLDGFPTDPWNWLLLYDNPTLTAVVNNELFDLVDRTGINFIDVHILMAHTRATAGVAPSDDDDSITDWANMSFMNNIVDFIDYCDSLGVVVELDLANNMWIPFSVDTANHLGNSPFWPQPDETPWTESIVWHTQIIEYVEANVANKDAIALWDMFGNYIFGAAEPVLWDRPEYPEIEQYTELYVKNVWPAFLAAGVRPKGAPIVLPILTDDPNWNSKPTAIRLSGISNLKSWIIDDLGMPPDYWVMSTYVKSDPADDGVYYIRGILDIIGWENVGKVISTDFKGAGHDLSGQHIDRSNLTPAEMYRWNFDRVMEYGFAGWWFWAYRDTGGATVALWGIRDLADNWREGLVAVVEQAANPLLDEPWDFDEAWVDFGYGGFERGKSTHPYSTLSEAIIRTTDNAVIKIKGGSSTSETPLIDTPKRLEAINGTVRIGDAGGRSTDNSPQSGFVSRD